MIDLDNGTQFEIDILSLEKIANSLTQKDIELLVVKNDEIKELNKEHRNIDKATDVLSFPMDFEMPHMPLGSIVISTDFVEEKAKEYAAGTAIISDNKVAPNDVIIEFIA